MAVSNPRNVEWEGNTNGRTALRYDEVVYVYYNNGTTERMAYLYVS